MPITTDHSTVTSLKNKCMGVPSMTELFDMLRIAMLLEAIPNALAAMFAIAEGLARNNENERAFEIVAMILQYPLHETLHVEAEILYDELESQLCPRVVNDVNTRVQELTLDDMVSTILRTDAL